MLFIVIPETNQLNVFKKRQNNMLRLYVECNNLRARFLIVQAPVLRVEYSSEYIIARLSTQLSLKGSSND